MAIKTLKLEGIRSFKEERIIDFSVPDGKNEGSGLNIFVGPNNGGKSTIVESLYLLNGTSNFISENVYNNSSNKFYVEAINDDRKKVVLSSDRIGSASCNRNYYDKDKVTSPFNLKIFVVPTKREISDNFGSGNQDRYEYSRNNGNNFRKNYRNDFGNRIIKADQRKDRSSFQKELEKVIKPVPDWQVKMNDNNLFYMQFKFGDVVHKSIDSGDGYINLFNIVDSIYDAKDGDTIVIDEPEISLHPELQQNLMAFFLEHSKTKQIIIATHSVFLVDWEIYKNGGKIFRVIKENNTSNIYYLSQDTINKLNVFDDPQKIPMLGLSSAEIFFLSDNVILTEGQDDVICYRKLFKKFDYIPNAHFFGWGVYGADRMQHVLDFLYDLGYKKLFAIFDHNKLSEMNKLELDSKYGKCKFYAIAADDVRQKKIKKCKCKETKTDGIVKDMKTMEIDPKYQDEIPKLINSMTEYFEDNSTEESIDYNIEEQTLDDKELTYEDIFDLIENCLSLKCNELKDKIYHNIEFNKGDIDVNIENTEKYQYWLIKYYEASDRNELDIYFKVKYDYENKIVKDCIITKIDDYISGMFIKKIYRKALFKYNYLRIKENIIKDFNEKIKDY